MNRPRPNATCSRVCFSLAAAAIGLLVAPPAAEAGTYYRGEYIPPKVVWQQARPDVQIVPEVRMKRRTSLRPGRVASVRLKPYRSR